jgi:hypothetical protein
MNMNSAQSGMLKLHATYNLCLKNHMDAFLANDTTKVVEQGEWCAAEKNAYMMYMKEHVPTEYDNLMRLEENNF